MTLTFSDILIAIILFSCVPVQYFLVQNWGYSESSRTYALNRFFNRVSKFKDDYLTFDSWKTWFLKVFINNLPSAEPYISKYSESSEPALKYQHKNGYFAFSLEPRTNRPPDVKYHVGQVIVHKNWKYKGVVIGWDEKAKAPKEWLDEMHGKENKHWRNMPNYSILVDVRDRLTPQITYVPQENIEAITNTKIIHPLLDDHFEGFDGAQYIPRPWLKTLYPQD